MSNVSLNEFKPTNIIEYRLKFQKFCVNLDTIFERIKF